MFVSPRRARLALGGTLIAAACVILAGCSSDKPAPSSKGFYDGPMKPKSAVTNVKGPAAGQDKSAAGEP